MNTFAFMPLLLLDLFQCYVGFCHYLLEKRQVNFNAVPNLIPEASVRRELPIVLDRVHPLRVTRLQNICIGVPIPYIAVGLPPRPDSAETPA